MLPKVPTALASSCSSVNAEETSIRRAFAHVLCPSIETKPEDIGCRPELGGAFLRLLGSLVLLLLAPWNERRVDAGEDHLLVDDALGDVLAGGELVHHVQQHLFQDGPQASGTRPPQQSLFRDGLHRVLAELELHAVEFEELLVLLDQRILGLGEDVDEGLLVEVVHVGDDRESSDELNLDKQALVDI